MIRWNAKSNVADVLALGPRTAGRLASCGVRTAADLLASAPEEVASRGGFEAVVIRHWQAETRLVLEAPSLSGLPARMLAAIGVGTTKQLGGFTPLELVAAFESTKARAQTPDWLHEVAVPGPREASSWIESGRKVGTRRAA